jgi:hypothetical protein
MYSNIDHRVEASRHSVLLLSAPRPPHTHTHTPTLMQVCMERIHDSYVTKIAMVDEYGAGIKKQGTGMQVGRRHQPAAALARLLSLAPSMLMEVQAQSDARKAAPALSPADAARRGLLAVCRCSSKHTAQASAMARCSSIITSSFLVGPRAGLLSAQGARCCCRLYRRRWRGLRQRSCA